MTALILATLVIGIAFVVVSVAKRSVEARGAERQPEPQPACEHHCCRCTR